MKKRLVIILSILFVLMVAAACSSSPEESEVKGNDKEVDQNEEVEDEEEIDNKDDFEEADKVADEFRIALMKADFDGMDKLASPNLSEQLRDVEDDDYPFPSRIDEGEVMMPNSLEIIGDYYGFYRYDDLYDEDEGVVWYKVETLNMIQYDDYEMSDDDIRFEENLDILYDTMYDTPASRQYIPLKQDDDGEWKAGRLDINLPDSYSQEERESAEATRTVINERPTKEEVEELINEDDDIDDFGF